LNEAGLLAAREEDGEIGGYFIINGLEKVLRLIQVPMRNMPLAIRRPAFKGRGSFFTQYAVTMRCARPDQSTCTVTLHYLANGNLRLRVSVRRRELLIPLVIILKALRQAPSDQKNIAGSGHNHSICAPGRKNEAGPLALLGSLCASLFGETLPQDINNATLGVLFLKEYIAVHVDHFSSKHDTLMLMARKLSCFARGACCEDNVDSISHQELLLPGHVLSSYTREKIVESFTNAISHIRRDPHNAFESTKIVPNCSKILSRYLSTIGAKIGDFIASGNLVSSAVVAAAGTTRWSRNRSSK